MSRVWSLKTRVTVVTSSVWLVSLWAMTVAVSTWQRADLQEFLGSRQLSTASVVAEQLTHQLGDRVFLLRQVAAQVRPEWIGQPERLQEFLLTKVGMTSLFNAGGYIAGRDGVAVASVPETIARRGVDYSDRRNVQATLLRGTTEFSDVVMGRVLGAPVFSISVPIWDPGKSIVGVLAGVVDLSQPNFLDNLGQGGLAGNAGLLLIDRSQRMIVTASDKTRSTEQLQAPGVNPAIDRYLAGAEGISVLTNPRGVSVLVGVKQIPEADWYIAAYIPTSEAFAPVDALQRRLVLLALLLTALTGLANWFVLRRQLAPLVDVNHRLALATRNGVRPGPLPVSRLDEIGKLIASFNGLLDALAAQEQERARYEAQVSRHQRLDALGLLAGGIAHDFNNLLAGLFGNLELALLKQPHGAAEPYLRKSLDVLDRARGLTRQLLTFSKGGEPDLRTQPLFPFVEDATRFALSGSSVSLQIDAPADLLPCRYDKGQLGQVIDNLTINAVQAMPAGGAFQIAARNGDGQVELTFTDTGTGMSPSVLEHVFDPFFTTKAEGHGLGLTTCHSIVRQHGGTIEALSREGQGTQFRIVLPAALEGLSVEPSRAAELPKGGGGTVLVLEDEAAVGEVLAAYLEALGYEAVVTTTGEGAVAALDAREGTSSSVRAAILDLTVPGALGGIETLALLRQRRPDLPAIVSSGFAETPVLANPAQFGFQAVLRKPYLRADLEAALLNVF